MPIALFSSVGNGIYNFVYAINMKIKKSRNPELVKFKENVNDLLVEFIETDLQASENALHITRQREIQLQAIITNQKDQTDKTEEILDEERSKKE